MFPSLQSARWISVALSLILLPLALGLGGGCGSRSDTQYVLLTDPARIVASPAIEDAPGIFRLKVTQGDQDWTIRSVVPQVAQSGGMEAKALETALRQRIHWNPPYLFVRENHGDRQGWRSTVDHVFKQRSNTLDHVGTVAAMGDVPGSQYRNGQFLDIYDRLEFTFLTSRPEAPKITLVMNERDSRFVVDLDATWREGQNRWQTQIQELERLSLHPEQLVREIDQRRARAVALWCLAFTRYCARPEEHDKAVALTRKVVEDPQSLVDEVQTVRSGEIAPSMEEVFRANPALLNLFRETPSTNTDAGGPASPLQPTAIGLSPI